MTVAERLARIGITGDRAVELVATLDADQVAKASDAQLRTMVAGREAGDATDHGHLYPDGHLYPA